MKRLVWSVTGAALLALVLAACSTTDTQRNSTADTSTSATSGSGTGSGANTASGTGTSTGSDTSSGSGSNSALGTGNSSAGSSTSSTASVVPNSTVTSILIMQKPAGSTNASGAVGGSGTAGSMGTGAGTSMDSDHSYRITLRMDDGRTQVVTQDTAPSFANGDRVRFSNGFISR
jgi:hypothetical protein